MKWIGQHIWSFISRFRNDVYFENVENGTTDTDKFLVIGAAGKLKYRTGAEVLSDIGAGNGDITGVSITTDSGSGSRASATSGTADFSLLGDSGVGITNSGATITAIAVPGEIDHDSLLNFAANEHFTQANITTVGTISSGTWQGSAIATTYTAAKVTSIVAGDGIDVSGATGDVTVTAETATDSNPGVVELATTAEAVTGTDTDRAVTPAGLKARVSQIINLKGYLTLQDGVYDYANPFNADDEAPFQIDTSYGSGTIDSSTEVAQNKLFRSGGFHVPFACTITDIHAQVTCNNAGNVSIAIVEYRPSSLASDQNDYPRTVYETVVVASADNNNKVTSTTIATGDLDATAVPAGSHIMMMVKGDGTSAGGTTIVSVAIGLSW